MLISCHLLLPIVLWSSSCLSTCTTSTQSPRLSLHTLNSRDAFFSEGIATLRLKMHGVFSFKGCVARTFFRPPHSLRKPGSMALPQFRTAQPGAKAATAFEMSIRCAEPPLLRCGSGGGLIFVISASVKRLLAMGPGAQQVS